MGPGAQPAAEISVGLGYPPLVIAHIILAVVSQVHQAAQRLLNLDRAGECLVVPDAEPVKVSGNGDIPEKTA